MLFSSYLLMLVTSTIAFDTLDVTKRWCLRNKTTIDEIVTKSRREKEVDCLELYKFAREGWKYDDVRMKRKHGDEHGVSSYFDKQTNDAKCSVFIPERISRVNVTDTVLECCNGWSGSHCQHRNQPLGRCHYDETCTSSSYVTSSNDYVTSQRAFSLDACCVLLGGITWIDGNNACYKCANVTSQSQKNDEDYSVGKKNTCVALNKNYYVTFEGGLIKTSNYCAYRLVTPIDESWWIDVQNYDCDDVTSCSRKVRATFGDDVIITLIGNDVYFNDEEVLGSFSKRGITIKRRNPFVTFESSIGVRITWDGKSIVVMTIDDDIVTTGGLCGARSGTDVTTRWITEDIEHPADMNSRDLALLSSPHSCHNDVIDDVTCVNDQLSRSICEFILEDESFDKCRKIVSPVVYYEICSSSVCNTLTSSTDAAHVTFCESAMTYMLTCAASGVKVLEWMERMNCSMNCPAGMEFTECATRCQPSCDSPDHDTSSYCYDDCLPGCQCPQGTLFNDRVHGNRSDVIGIDVCVTSDRCPCKHRGRVHEQNDEIIMDCNKCICERGGAWKCSTNRCHAVCHVISAAHVITFDNSKLSLRGSVCLRNILVQSIKNSSRHIEIEAEIVTSQTDGRSNLEHIRTLRIEIGSHEIKLKRNMEASLNGTDLVLPYRNKDISVRHATTHSFVIKSFGLNIVWIPVSNTLDVVLEPAYANKVQGICGTFSWNSKDDLTTPDGDVETIPELFVKKFQRSGNGNDCSILDTTMNDGDIIIASNMTSFVRDPCVTHTQRRHYAKRTCKILSGKIFKKCNSVVDPTSYEEACVYDVCASSDDVTTSAVCRSMSAYAFACMQSNDVTVTSQVVAWRRIPDLNGACDLQCPTNLHFDECQPIGSTSCSDTSKPLPSYQYASADDEIKCIPGCSCPPGRRLTSLGLVPLGSDVTRGLSTRGFDMFGETMVCVAMEECPCHHKGRFHQRGSEMKSGCVKCSCDAGRWNCSSEECGATIRCPNNMLYSQKMTQCDHITCDNSDRIELLRNNGECDDELSYEGCKCPDGMMQENNRCIHPEECPCRHSGKLYERNGTIVRDCNTCVCEGGKWNCTNYACAAVCVATGDPHFVTFDGAQYSFQGSCGYLLARETTGLFQITSENVPCGSAAVTCTKSVYVTVGRTSVHLLRGKRITVNGAKIGRLPRRYGNDDVNSMAIDVAGIYVVVSWPHIGLSVMWDGGTRVQVQLSPRHMRRVSGLCGNYDMSVKNEFQTRQGSIETLVTSFADTWKLSPACSETTAVQTTLNTNPCEADIHRAPWARRRCSIISNGGIFEECRSVVPHATYYNWCVYDACACDSGGDCECVCTAIAAYAQACSQQHVHVRWRSQDLCPMQCDHGMVYMECGNVCQDTCRGSEIGSHCSTLPCVEGCFCPRDMVMHDQRCVKKSRCSCMLEGGEFEPGTFVHKNCQNCTCVNGEWDCKGENCTSVAPSCGGDHFLCGDALACIMTSWRCDFERDCSDGSDEIGCDWTISECNHAGGHVCGSGNCLLPDSRCDGIVDCDDGSDELYCDVTDNNGTFSCDGFSCMSGNCIEESLRCDGAFDCGFGDFSDESNCRGNCSLLRHFTCKDGGCITRVTLCDGDIDCSDGSDESSCICSPSQFTCIDSGCIDRVLVCDDSPDCLQGEDEYGCVYTSSQPETTISPTVTSPLTTTTRSECPEFHCDYDVTMCIGWNNVCDNKYDCSDLSDETDNCHKECKENEVSCDGGLLCIDIKFLCDGFAQCRDRSDESDDVCDVTTPTCTSGFLCKDGICLNGSMICDGTNHCHDGEDESGCSHATTVTMPTTYTEATNSPCQGHTCLDGNCIDLNRVCNGVDECVDRRTNTSSVTSTVLILRSSDEAGCATWSEWSGWGECSQSCGSGVRLRNRACSPGHDDNGHVISEKEDPLRSQCRGQGSATQPCFNKTCTNDTDDLTQWSDWSDCSVTCGGGLSSRWRYCVDGTRTCSRALYSGSGIPLLEIKSCSEGICPDQNCSGNKIFYDCGSRNFDFINPCPLTCRDLVRGGDATCVTSQETSDCNSGCYCPRGYVTINETSDKCVEIDDCPCYENGKIYFRGDEVRRKETCQICQCSGGGRWRGCMEDPSCDSSQLCGWTSWSDWGPCFGPCGVNGVQWAFRSPLLPSRYGQGRRCQGVYRKSRRCPTPSCGTCDITSDDVSDTRRNVGDKWKKEPCEICSCLEDGTVECKKYCEYSIIGCPGNGTLIEPTNDETCCYCQQYVTSAETSTVFSATSQSADSVTSSFIHDVFTVKSVTMETTDVTDEELHMAHTTAPIYDVTTARTDVQTNEFTRDDHITTTSSYEGSGTSLCSVYQYQCRTSMECVESESICDDVIHCIDGSDESEELCRHNRNGDASCNYQPWSDWSKCSHTCGLGQHTRHRGMIPTTIVTSHDECSGPFQIFKPCYVRACARDGSWSSWKSWSQCSRNCGGGIQVRRRNCDSPWPLNGGRECPGVCSETRVCQAAPCTPGLCSGGKIYLNGSRCIDYQACSQSCDDLSADVRCRSECVLRHNNGGCFCPRGRYLQDGECVTREQCRCTVNHQQYEPASIFSVNGCECKCVNGRSLCSSDCSVDCGWSVWSTWTHCDRTCGVSGRIHRFRSPSNPITSGARGKKCVGPVHETRMCHYEACPPTWGSWGRWGDCSATCGVGIQQRSNNCEIDGQIVTSSYCVGSRVTQHRTCFNIQCESCPHGVEYACVTCPRTCSDVISDVKCLEKCVWTCSCPEGKYLQDNNCVPISNCSCDVTQYVTSVSTNGVLLPGESFNLECNTCTCIDGRVDCTNQTCSNLNVALWEWSPWSRWSQCSRTCFDINNISSAPIGYKRRYRQCLRKQVGQTNKGQITTDKHKCDGLSEQTSQCGVTLCIVASSWSSWGRWSNCDKTCGGGIQTSTRICRSRSEFDAESCDGSRVKVRSCSMRPCVDGRCKPGSHHVNQCQSNCTKEPSCYDVSSEIETDDVCSHGNYSESDCDVGYCRCDEGLLWQDGKCVQRHQCNCYVMGRTRKSGSSFHIGSCTTCTCNGGDVTCQPKTDNNGAIVCDENQPCYDVTRNDVTWTSWTACSKSCDVGIRRRFSSTSFDDKYIGAWCRHRAEEQEDCNVMSCSRHNVNCDVHPGICNQTSDNTTNTSTGWSSWSSWGMCSSTCVGKYDGSWRHRYRKCLSNDTGVRDCVGPETQSSICDDSVLPPCDASWSTWSHWSKCSVTCLMTSWNNGNAYQSRTRTCTMDKQCSGETRQFRICENHSSMTSCSNDTIDPSSDEDCDRFVSGSRYSECVPLCTSACSGEVYCAKSCVSGCSCPVGKLLNRDKKSCVTSTQCKCFDDVTGTAYDNGQTFKRNGSCQQACECENGMIRCEDCQVKPSWCSWSHWTACTRTCGRQERIRIRSCSSNTTDPRLSCTGSRNHTSDVISGERQTGYQIERSFCRIYPECPGDRDRLSQWGGWGEWSECTCDTSYTMRRRECDTMTSSNNLTSSLKRLECVGPSLQTKTCRFDSLRCGYQCPRGLQLSPCKEGNCPKSCIDLSPTVQCIDEGAGNITDRERRWDKCVPQCTCPPGLLLNPSNHEAGYECVPHEQCSCFIYDATIKPNRTDLQRFKFSSITRIGVNESFVTNCEKCLCRPGGTLHCHVISDCDIASDGGWSLWTTWGACSSTCSSGTQWRVRMCGTSSCDGANEQTRRCVNDVSCIMTSWEAWSDCSRTCGVGIRSRWRSCLPDRECDEDRMREFEKCEESTFCEAEYSEWTNWSRCSVTCGEGQQSRARSCGNGTRESSVDHCSSTMNSSVEIPQETESRSCHGKNCSGSTNRRYFWSTWSDWSSCAGECGTGRQTRERNCLAQSVNKQIHINDGCQGESVLNRRCALLPCPSNTSSTSCPIGMILKRTCDDCSRTEGGLVSRLPRTCSEIASGTTASCDTLDCTPVCVCEDSLLLQLHDGGGCVTAHRCECSDDVGHVWPPGTTWTMTSQEEQGSNCSSQCSCSIGRISCDDRQCESRDPCGWSLWSSWTSCNSSCHDHVTKASRFRFRSANTSLAYNESCDHDVMQIGECPGISACNGCHGDDYLTKNWTMGNCSSCKCNGDRSVVCSDTCWSQWSDWSQCSSTCGSDLFKIRKRFCISNRNCSDDVTTIERVLCNHVTATSYDPCPDVTTVPSTIAPNHTEATSCFDDVTCPEMTCRDGEVKMMKKGECCMTCQPEIENVPPATGACAVHTEHRNFSLDGCASRDTRISFCDGNCRSSVHVLPYKPFVHTSCDCCTHHLDDLEPYVTVTLRCTDQSERFIVLPNITSCSCTACSGNKDMLSAEP